MDPVMQLIRDHARTVMSTGGSHGFDHVERVTALCERIGKAEGADMTVLIPAALLHDIARPLEKERGLPHEQEGARMAEEYLASIRYDASAIPAIAAAIRAHRFRSTEMPESLESRVLSDADKLDALGAVGIARTFLRAGEHSTSIEDGIAHFHEKLLRLPGLMYTKTARQIAEDRHAFLTQFLGRLEDEMADRME